MQPPGTKRGSQKLVLRQLKTVEIFWEAIYVSGTRGLARLLMAFYEELFSPFPGIVHAIAARSPTEHGASR